MKVQALIRHIDRATGREVQQGTVFEYADEERAKLLRCKIRGAWQSQKLSLILFNQKRGENRCM